MISLELLAPALDPDTAEAAILTGADAVYIGGPAFSARQEAHNELSDLKELCAFAHQFKVRVHVAVNTLLYDGELPAAQALIAALGEVGADAVILQDPALLMSDFPAGLEVHASTQCLINTVEKLKFYQALGFKQAVLPRELTLKEIALFHQACPEITLECFISGALCVSESGNCFISEQLLRRSGNRGRCAQLCRLPMELKHEGRTLALGHLLSMKDNLCVDLLPELVAAGVRSFKIEGRLKPKAYVVNQVGYLSEVLNRFIHARPQAYRRSSAGRVKLNFRPDLKKTFNRGFTHELLQGGNEDLVNSRTPKFQGEQVGTVRQVSLKGAGSCVEIILCKSVQLHNQDGFTYYEGNKLRGFACNTAEGHTLSVRGRLKLPEGTVLYRNHDAEFIRTLSRPEASSRELRCYLTLEIGEQTLKLKLEDECGRCAEAALAYRYDSTLRSIGEEKLISTLKKRPSPGFVAESISFKGDLNRLTLPLSAINALRKQAYANLRQGFLRSLSDCRYTLPNPLPAYPEQVVDSRLILNALCRDFYRRCGVDVTRDLPGPQPLMTCKHCLIKAHALCSKEGGTTRGFTLHLGGHEFKLGCDCRHCKMLVYHG